METRNNSKKPHGVYVKTLGTLAPLYRKAEVRNGGRITGYAIMQRRDDITAPTPEYTAYVPLEHFATEQQALDRMRVLYSSRNAEDNGKNERR